MYVFFLVVTHKWGPHFSIYVQAAYCIVWYTVIIIFWCVARHNVCGMKYYVLLLGRLAGGVPEAGRRDRRFPTRAGPTAPGGSVSKNARLPRWLRRGFGQARAQAFSCGYAGVCHVHPRLPADQVAFWRITAVT